MTITEHTISYHHYHLQRDTPPRRLMGIFRNNFLKHNLIIKKKKKKKKSFKNVLFQSLVPTGWFSFNKPA